MSHLAIVVEKPSDRGSHCRSDNVAAASGYPRGDGAAGNERAQAADLHRLECKHPGMRD